MGRHITDANFYNHLYLNEKAPLNSPENMKYFFFKNQDNDRIGDLTKALYNDKLYGLKNNSLNQIQKWARALNTDEYSEE